MSSIDKRLEQLEEMALRLSVLSGDLSREILAIRFDQAKSGPVVSTLDTFTTGPAPKSSNVSTSLDVSVEKTIDSSKVKHLYVRFIELPNGGCTQHVVGLNSKGEPLGVRTTHIGSEVDPEDVEDIKLIPATRERLSYVGWVDQTAPRKPGEAPWKKI